MPQVKIVIPAPGAQVTAFQEIVTVDGVAKGAVLAAAYGYGVSAEGTPGYQFDAHWNMHLQIDSQDCAKDVGGGAQTLDARGKWSYFPGAAGGMSGSAFCANGSHRADAFQVINVGGLTPPNFDYDVVFFTVVITPPEG